MSFLSRRKIRVNNIGQLVELKMGNVEITMDHECALVLAQYLRMYGKYAKAIAGDHGRKWRAVGLLTNAEANDKLNIRNLKHA